MSCWFPVILQCFTSSSLFRFRAGPSCVPMRPRPVLNRYKMFSTKRVWDADKHTQEKKHENIYSTLADGMWSSDSQSDLEQRNVFFTWGLSRQQIILRRLQSQTRHWCLKNINNNQTTSFVCVCRSLAGRRPRVACRRTDNAFSKAAVQIFLDQSL